MNEKDLDRNEKKLIESVYKSLFKNGDFTLSDLNDKEKFRKKILEINKKADYQIVVDYSDNLINNAKEFIEKGDFNNAKIFYATYFEHQLNRIINELCYRKSISKKEINNIIKSINLIGKLTWLPLILGIPKISIKHKNVILKLAEDRNAFIHYKHNPEPNERNENFEQKQHEEVIKIEKTITYFKKYTSRLLYNNQKIELEKKLKNR